MSLLTGWFVNLNYVSIHSYYRDRLMEAFLPRPDTDGTTGPAVDADRATLSAMCVPHAPYHLVNTNVVLVDSDTQRWRKRGGDAFVLSPRYCGGSATGWVPTADYMRRDPLTLPTAIAISGAAANPNTAAGGAGPTRRPMLSLLMALLNVRLGYWVPHLGARRQPAVNHFRAAWHELLPRGFAENRNLLQLSAGGHFENLGVYELVRRRVRLIVCCDAAADPAFAFKDLQVLMRPHRHGLRRADRVRRSQPDRAPHRPRPRPAESAGPRWHDRRLPGRRPVLGARLRAGCGRLPGRQLQHAHPREDDDDPGLDLLLRGYKGANRDFPDQTTADQFFDEEQFEAYRELGYHLAGTLIDDRSVDLEGLLRNCA